MAKDIFHEAVKFALIKDGWIITNDPLTIRIDKVKLEVDLAAEKVIAAQKNGQKIAIEIKSLALPGLLCLTKTSNYAFILVKCQQIKQRSSNLLTFLKP